MRTLFIAASGLGNSILLSPTIQRLRADHSNDTLDLFVYRDSFATPYRGSDLLDQIFTYNGVETIRQLRNQNYDVSICGFPSNRWQYNVFSRLVGAPRRIAHDYPVGYARTFRCLQTDLVEARQGLHDVEQNLRLLDVLDLSPASVPDPIFHLDRREIHKAKQFINQQELLNAHLIGVHPGSGPQKWKRAPMHHFLSLISERQKESSAVLIFGGPEEQQLKLRLQEKIRSTLEMRGLTINTDLKQTAALIGQCDIFVSNDSGLSHVAAAVDVPSQVTLFNGTDPTRTAPWRDDAERIRLRKNRMRYPFFSTAPPILPVS